jgi:aquaporin rerated protein, other eukaryote
MNVNAPSERFISLPFIGKKRTSLGTQVNPSNNRRELRLPFIGFLPNKVRNHIIAFLGEFVGTFLFLFFAFAATQVANAAAEASNQTSGAGVNTTGGISQAPNASTLLYISLAFGFSLAVNAWVFFRISGGESR